MLLSWPAQATTLSPFTVLTAGNGATFSGFHAGDLSGGGPAFIMPQSMDVQSTLDGFRLTIAATAPFPITMPALPGYFTELFFYASAASLSATRSPYGDLSPATASLVGSTGVAGIEEGRLTFSVSELTPATPLRICDAVAGICIWPTQIIDVHSVQLLSLHIDDGIGLGTSESWDGGTPTPVPEPAAFLLIGTGLIGIAWLRRT